MDESTILKFLMLIEAPQDITCSQMSDFSLTCKGSLVLWEVPRWPKTWTFNYYYQLSFYIYSI